MEQLCLELLRVLQHMCCRMSHSQDTPSFTACTYCIRQPIKQSLQLSHNGPMKPRVGPNLQHTAICQVRAWYSNCNRAHVKWHASSAHTTDPT
jgi:hypothetical protein